MAASFEWTIANGAGETITTLGTSGNLQDYKSIDSAGIADYAANPIVAGTNSFELWLKPHWTGSFNRVSDVRFWMSTGFSPSTGLAVFWTGVQNLYLQPANGTSSIATSSVPIADPGSANVSIGGNLSGSLVAAGYSDFIVLQLRTTTAAAAGDTSLSTCTLSYAES